MPSEGRGALPTNVEAEQALLGAILHDNRCFDAVADFLRPEHVSCDGAGFVDVYVADQKRTALGGGYERVESLLKLRRVEFHEIEEVRAGTSYGSSSDPRVTFGLGDATVVDSLEVRWPTGKVQRFEKIPVRSWIKVTEGEDTVEVLATGNSS